MKKLPQLSNEMLHSHTLSAASNEKSATLVLLDHLGEIDRRRLYAIMGYSSLWLYVNKALGYSETQASERVSAMRLIVKMPDVKKALETGKISLTSAAKLAAHVRREKTEPSETNSLLKAIIGKSSREVERIFASETSDSTRPDQLKAITSETTRITIDVGHEFLAMMNRVKELKGHAGSGAQELFKISMQELIKRYEVKHATKLVPEQVPEQKLSLETKRSPIREYRKKVKQGMDADTGLLVALTIESELPAQKVLLAPPPVTNPKSRYISINIRNRIRLRSGDQCEYIDSISKRRCNCKTKLQFDHITPYSFGGLTAFENIRHYCVSHNQLSAIRQFGREHMQPFMKN